MRGATLTRVATTAPSAARSVVTVTGPAWVRRRQPAGAVPLRVGYGRGDRRVAAERHLGERAEVPDVQGAVVGVHHERRLRVADVGRRRQHHRVVGAARVEHHPGRVATLGIRAERHVAQYLHAQTVAPGPLPRRRIWRLLVRALYVGCTAPNR